jgi:hypothetical protein
VEILKDKGDNNMRTSEELRELQEKVKYRTKNTFFNDQGKFIEYLEDIFINHEGKETISWSSQDHIFSPWDNNKVITVNVLDRLLHLYNLYGTLNIRVTKNTWSREITLS